MMHSNYGSKSLQAALRQLRPAETVRQKPGRGAEDGHLATFTDTAPAELCTWRKKLAGFNVYKTVVDFASTSRPHPRGKAASVRRLRCSRLK